MITIAEAWEIVGLLRQMQFTVRLSAVNGQFGGSLAWRFAAWKYICRDSGELASRETPYGFYDEVLFRAEADSAPEAIRLVAQQVMGDR